MTKKEFVKLLEKYPDDAEMILIDVTTDNPEVASYEITEDSIGEIPLIRMEDDEELTGVAIGFFNQLNPDPIEFKMD